MSSYTLNCLVLGCEPGHIFEIKIASSKNVIALRELIKKKKKHDFRDIDADNLLLMELNEPYDEALENHLNNLALGARQAKSIPPVLQLSDVFSEQPPSKNLHIIVRLPRTVPVVPQMVGQRLAYLKEATGAPSAAIGTTFFSNNQKYKKYLCNRPRTVTNPLPVTLLDPIFAAFVDDCQNHQPTVGDNNFVRQLSESMSLVYDSELERMMVFRQLLREYAIILDASMVGATRFTTDGHLLSRNGKFVQVIAEGKNEIGSTGAEPFAQAMMYYRSFLQAHNTEIAELQSVMPCIFIIVFGACIGFAGSVFTDKVQCDILGPIIPLFYHITDLPMQVMAARTFGALRIASEKIATLYSQQIPHLAGSVEDASLGCPYPWSYIHSNDRTQAFSYNGYQPLRDRLIFFGETVGDEAGRKICMKFVRRYSREAHDFCASKGHSPKLIAYQPLAGGWYMVIMDALDIGNAQRPGSYQPLSATTVSGRRPLKETITSLIKELHDSGFVHGDIRDANLFVGDNKPFMLLDFDWAGPVETARYPIHVNREGILRPDGAWDGERILVQHDLFMLKHLFPTEDDSQETATKRRRISTGEESAMDILA